MTLMLHQQPQLFTKFNYIICICHYIEKRKPLKKRVFQSFCE